MDRRTALSSILAVSGAGILPAEAAKIKAQPFIYSLNMSTLRGHKLGFRKELEVASKAGFGSVEIWINTLQDYLKTGGTLQEAKKIINDLGIKVEDAIGFATWIVDDESARSKAIEQLKVEMDQLAQIGCPRIAAPPMGATTGASLDLAKVAERYRTILELGDKTGVVPHLELWGFSKNLSRVGEILYVAVESGHPSARLLMDVYHLHKGGSGMDAVKDVGKPLVEIFHINDYPATPPRETITDADRVYAGDGVAPLKDLLKSLKNPDRPVILSFEVFNKDYYAQDALLVAKTGLTKMKKVTEGV
ncbi:sugar phosphate isomerase/epimerase family protein [Dyadobacter fanqingshengii]|uniref:Sugar phosphate isomerase/epimerase n=1 Tax=Dyadobacter fanqingshengii TaxID=2906443 RepID=A0A9X1TBA0_9BACT|nr:sugar phosphate isomerase/epimerase family protein [Dyadobacter fanqingshengii]MCF0041749.1 sugar phosphate isomerase/epimerase [Dyadobacter fanqingshengii]USJ36538.1 sugar phosphate isomerase/epimerase [Dyadobacter fanqingshengii]